MVGGAGGEPSHDRHAALVGRDALVDELGELVQSAVAGAGGLVVLSGPVGIGKTRLLDEVAVMARSAGAAVARGAGSQGGGAPTFWVWTQILRGITQSVAPGVADSLSPPQAAALSQISPDIGGQSSVAAVDRFAVFDAVAGFLVSAGRRHPLVLLMDDLEAAGEDALRLLHHVAVAARESPVLLAAAYDADEAGDPGTRSLLGDLARSGRHVRLEPLPDEPARRLARNLLGAGADDLVVDTLVRASEGNPLFLHEATRLATDPQGLTRPDFSTGFRVPEGARGVIQTRLAALPANILEVLEVAAVVGRDFDAATVARVLGRPADDVLDDLAEPLRRTVLAEKSALGEFTFTHILLRETLYEGLPTARRMRLHRKVAEGLEEQFASNLEPHLARLAHHWFKAAQAGDPARALDYAVRAGGQAEALGGIDQARRLYQRAMRIAEVSGLRDDAVAQVESALVRLDAGVPSGAAPVPGPTRLAPEFRRTGDVWNVSFEGKTSQLLDSKGMAQLAHLLARPGHEVHAMELAGVDARSRPRPKDAPEELSLASDDMGPVLDDAALRAYRGRLAELEEDLEEALSFNDTTRAERLQGEKDALLDQLRAAVGLGGRSRRAGSNSERARVGVTRTIKHALARIEEANPALGSHLRSTIRTGTYCGYFPDPRVPIEWQLS